MLTPPVDEKLSYWLFTISLTNDEKNELKKYGTKFDRVVSTIPKFNLTDEELIKEIELHDKKLEIIHQFNTLNIKNYDFFTALDKDDEIVQLKYKEYTENYEKRAIRTTVYRSKWECKVIPVTHETWDR